MLRWSPDQFWQATPYELSCAYIGYCKSEGAGHWEVKEDGWSGASIEAHRSEIEALVKAIPDAPLDRDMRRKLKELKRRG